YYLTLLAILSFGLLRPGAYTLDGWSNYATFTPYIQAYWGGKVPDFAYPFQPAWFPAAEMQFYLVWPFVGLGCGRRGMLPALLVVIGVAMVGRWMGWDSHLLLAHGDSLALGGLLAVVLPEQEERPDHRQVYSWSFLGLGVLALNYLTWGLILQGE